MYLVQKVQLMQQKWQMVWEMKIDVNINKVDAQFGRRQKAPKNSASSSDNNKSSTISKHQH